MAKIRGGVPGGWHGGLLPGASAPFRFRFDENGEAEIEREIAEYVTSVPGPFVIVEADENKQAENDNSLANAPQPDAQEDSFDESPVEESDETTETIETPDKSKRSRRKTSLDG